MKSPTLQRFFILASIVLAAVLLSTGFFRFDLTSGKRYTLSEYTKKSMRELPQEVHVKVYLAGELNIPFLKMKQQTGELLEEMQIYAGNRLTYEFINPFEGKDSDVQNEVIETLYEKGLRPAQIIDRDEEGGSSERLVFPGAVVYSGNREVPVNLLKNIPGKQAEENIHISVQSLEFEFTRVIGSVVSDTIEKIAFIEGHGEWDEFHTGDITHELGWYFQVDRGRINGVPGVLKEYKAVIIAGPTRPFSERDKFVLDQYIMNGGRVLWFVELVNASIDSISEGGTMVTLIRELNVEDLLFRYGVRINPWLVQDMQCNVIPVNVALAGNPPEFRPVPWLYSPLLSPDQSHPVSRNLNQVSASFCGTIDTLSARPAIRKTILLRSSANSRVVQAPVLVSLEDIRNTPGPELFTSPNLAVGLLLEGRFESAFINRPLGAIFPDTSVTLVEEVMDGAMLVAADADIIRNEIRSTPQGVLISPLGFDRYTSQTYGNKEFVINALQYLTGHEALMNLRSREIRLRLLNRSLLSSRRPAYAIANMLMPPLLVILGGIVLAWIRKRQYSRQTSAK